MNGLVSRHSQERGILARGRQSVRASLWVALVGVGAIHDLQVTKWEDGGRNWKIGRTGFQGPLNTKMPPHREVSNFFA